MREKLTPSQKRIQTIKARNPDAFKQWGSDGGNAPHNAPYPFEDKQLAAYAGSKSKRISRRKITYKVYSKKTGEYLGEMSDVN